ncbi:MAG: hypothetical protein QXI19_04385 [Candidatus Caldarchaeum sp.]
MTTPSEAYTLEVSRITKGIFTVDMLSRRDGAVIVIGRRIVFYGTIVDHLIKQFSPEQLVYHLLRHLDSGDYLHVLNALRRGSNYEPLKCKHCRFHEILEEFDKNSYRMASAPSFLSSITDNSYRVSESKIREKKRVSINSTGSGKSTPKRKRRAGTREASYDVIEDMILEAMRGARILRNLLEDKRLQPSPIVLQIMRNELEGRFKFGFSSTDFSRIDLKKERDFLTYKRRSRVVNPPVVLLDRSASMDVAIVSCVSAINALVHSTPIKVYTFGECLDRDFQIKYPHESIAPPSVYGGTKLWKSLGSLYEEEREASIYLVLTDGCSSDDLFLLGGELDGYHQQTHRTYLFITDRPMRDVPMNAAQKLGMRIEYLSTHGR